MMLNENAQIIFEEIRDHAKEFGINVSGQKEIEEIQKLAFHFDRHARICGSNKKFIIKDDFGNSILAPEYYIMCESMDYILENSDKYGMTPKARKDINDKRPKNLN